MRKKLIAFDIDGTLTDKTVDLFNSTTCIVPQWQQVYQSIITTYADQSYFAVCTNRAESEFKIVLKPFLERLFGDEHFIQLKGFKFGNGRLNDKNQSLAELQTEFGIESPEHILLVDDNLRNCVTPASIAGFSVLHCTEGVVLSGALSANVGTFIGNPVAYQQAQTDYYQRQHAQFLAEQKLCRQVQSFELFPLSNGSQSSLVRRRTRTQSTSAIDDADTVTTKVPQRSLSMNEAPPTLP